LRIDPLVQQGAGLTGGEETGAGQFGFSVALSANGRTALIGGSEDDGGLGAAWVFTRSGTTWTQQGEKLTAAEESGAAGFGSKVALSSEGNTALIGGPRDNDGVGAAWVFTRSGSSWTQQAKILAKGEVGDGSFGASVALSAEGNTALIGAPDDKSCVGAAWVYTRSGSTWTKQREFGISQEECPSPDSVKDWGTSVALSASGDTALVGGPPPGPFNEGGFWIFTRSGSAWTTQVEFDDLQFGESAALSADGNTALVGSLSADAHSGGAQVFTRQGATWSAQGPELTGTGERNRSLGVHARKGRMDSAGTTRRQKRRRRRVGQRRGALGRCRHRVDRWSRAQRLRRCDVGVRDRTHARNRLRLGSDAHLGEGQRDR
jgi:hypothetical protein